MQPRSRFCSFWKSRSESARALRAEIRLQSRAGSCGLVGLRSCLSRLDGSGAPPLWHSSLWFQVAGWLRKVRRARAVRKEAGLAGLRWIRSKWWPIRGTARTSGLVAMRQSLVVISSASCDASPLSDVARQSGDGHDCCVGGEQDEDGFDGIPKPTSPGPCDIERKRHGEQVYE